MYSNAIYVSSVVLSLYAFYVYILRYCFVTNKSSLPIFLRCHVVEDPNSPSVEGHNLRQVITTIVKNVSLEDSCEFDPSVMINWAQT